MVIVIGIFALAIGAFMGWRMGSVFCLRCSVRNAREKAFRELIEIEQHTIERLTVTKLPQRHGGRHAAPKR